jgi:hypothetical protein
VTASRGIRAKRSDAGQVRLTERDAAVVRFLGDQFGCPLSVVAELYGVGDRVARRHVGRLERAGFAGRLTVAGQQWVVPTRAGLRFADLEHEPWAPRAWKLEHVEQVARLRLALQRLYPGATWTSERQIRSRWANSGARCGTRTASSTWPMAAVSASSWSYTARSGGSTRASAATSTPAFDEVWWFCPAADREWLANVLEEIPKPERPAHHVFDLAGVLS